MASSAIFLTIILLTITASTSGFKIEARTIESERFKPTPFPTPRFIATSTTDYRNQPIAGYPKVPPPNAYESGGNDFDLLPPFEDISVKFDPRRSVKDERVDPRTGYPLVAEPSWKNAGGNEQSLKPPLDDAVDPKTGYPLVAKPHGNSAGGDGGIIALPLHADENFKRTATGAVNDGTICVLPYLGPDAPINPRTGKPFAFNQDMKRLVGCGSSFSPQAGGIVHKREIDPKTGYPLKADPSWKDAGGNEKILDLPLEDLNERSEEAVDPKTGYPLVAQDSWKHAGGDEEILELPLEDSEAVDPKTGYPLQAQPSWKDAGGHGDILEPPLEDNPNQGAVDPKTGYPLTAQPGWKDAGGHGDILEPPLEDNPNQGAVDPKTGYPLTAQPGWIDAGGNGDILQLPLDDTEEDGQALVDPKTGYPLVAQPSWKDAGGNGDILQVPLAAGEPDGAVDPKTGYPLVAQPEWKDAGGNEDILELPVEQSTGDAERRFHVFEIFKLTELQPPHEFSNTFSTSDGATNQKRNSFESQRFGFNHENRPVESSYTYTGPENVVVTVTRFLSTDRQAANGFSQNQQKPFNSNGNSGVATRAPQTTTPNFSIFQR